ncbi:MAG: hypothetical protein EA412_03920 [Chitinophagaceae bacterium]|nr:MAG: hypothetical protein EA412_03920 [Chitinophagaceae bacterium]
MKIKLNHLQTTKTARYYTLGSLSTAKEIWLVLHGYGQLAEEFIQNFKWIQHKDRYIVAPEGLSRFYLKGGKGKAVASWMTKEDRENEINDYRIYLDNLLKTLIANLKNKPDIIILGFSQGAATAMRFNLSTKRKIKQLILWSGSLAYDINWNKAVKLFNEKTTLTIVGGMEDNILPESLIQLEKESLQKKDIPFKYLQHPGKHEIHAGALAKIIMQNENL